MTEDLWEDTAKIDVGSVDDGVLSRMRPSCSSVSSCLLLLGVSPRTAGSSVTFGLSSSTVLALAVNIP